MPKPKSILFLFAILWILFLTLINFNSYLRPQKVLGVETVKADDSSDFWTDFLSKNPDYIPGLIEMGNLEKVKKIDPNYLYQP